MKRTDFVAIMAAVIAVLLIAGCVSGPQKETSTSTSSASSATPQPQTTSTQTTKTKTEQNMIGNKSSGY